MNLSPHQSSEARSLIQAGYRYALSLTHHVEDAEDLIQHACYKCLRAKGAIVSKSYLFTTIRNLSVDGRRRKSESQMPDAFEATLIDSSQQPNLQTDRKLEVEHLLGCLRPEEREALFLNCVEGYSASEISSLTGQPRGTVLSLLSRAKQRLRQDHTTHEPPGPQ